MEIFVNLTPFKHPEKSLIFLGTRFVPLSFNKGEGGGALREAAPLLNFLYFTKIRRKPEKGKAVS
jgi:hypothetical protein